MITVKKIVLYIILMLISVSSFAFADPQGGQDKPGNMYLSANQYNGQTKESMCVASTMPSLDTVGHPGCNAWGQCGYCQIVAGPNNTNWQTTAQGFSATISPMLPALICVFVVILAIWIGPGLLKKLLKTAVK